VNLEFRLCLNVDQSSPCSHNAISNCFATPYRDQRRQGGQSASSLDLCVFLGLIVSILFPGRVSQRADLHATAIPHFDAGSQYQPHLLHTSTIRITALRLSGTMLSQGSQRMPTEYRHMSTGSLNIPPPSALNGSGGPTTPVTGMGRFEGPRSPPGRQSEFMA
jgi:hypothetical protein